MRPDHAADTVRRATDMVNDIQISHPWLIEALGDLAKYAAEAVPLALQGNLALPVLEFPLPSEKGNDFPAWPRIVVKIWNAKPVRDATDTRWDHRVHQLIEASQHGQADRRQAVLCLAYLALHDALKPSEKVVFGKALWSDVDADENALPLNTSLLHSTLLKLPAADGIDVRARLSARLFDADLREVMKLPIPMGTAEIVKVEHLYAVARAPGFGLNLSADIAVRMFDEIVAWEPQNVDWKDSFAASLVKDFNDRIRFAAGNLLTLAVVPAMRPNQRTEQRARDLIAFVARTRSWTSLEALPLFLPSAPEAKDEITSTVRLGLIGSENQHVGSAALAICVWAKLVRDGTVVEFPRLLIDQLVATIETCREVGLSAMLDAARTLLRERFLLDGDIERLTQTLAMIRSEFRYENVDYDSMRAVSVSLVRAECMKLALALKDRLGDQEILQAWIDEARTDPLPEVRFVSV